MSAQVREEWVCSGCDMRVYTPSKKTVRPRLWKADDECHKCWVGSGHTSDERQHRREAVQKRSKYKPRRPNCVTPKKQPAPRKAPASERAEAELRADPSRTDRAIAEAIGVGKGTVRSARGRMGVPTATEVAKAAKGPGRAATKTATAEAALRSEPHRTSREVAEAIGASLAVVRTARRKVGVPAPKMDSRGRPIR